MTKAALLGSLFLSLGASLGCGTNAAGPAAPSHSTDGSGGAGGDDLAPAPGGHGGGGAGCPDGNDAKCDGCEDGNREMALVVDEGSSPWIEGVPLPLTEACVEGWLRGTEYGGAAVRGNIDFGPGGLDLSLYCWGEAFYECGVTFGTKSPSGFGYLDLHAPVEAGWHHVAACVRGEAYYSNELMAHAAVYVDGEKVDEDGFHAIGDVASAGSRSFDGEILGQGAIDELRFSSGWRYPDHPGELDSFALERHLALDASTLALYRFNGTLEDAAEGQHDISSDGIQSYEIDTGYRPEFCQ